MTRIKLRISYDGTDFFGWQRQNNTDQTVQGILENCLAQIYQQHIAVVGSGRTDRGVHALNQFAHFDLPEGLNFKRLPYQLRLMTPETISIKNAWVAPANFHAQISAIRKTYIYRLQVGPTWNPFMRRWAWKPLKQPSIKYLQEASSLLLGEHDFTSFQSRGTVVSSTVRRLELCQWKIATDNLWVFKITGNGFLKQMVRNIVGTIIEHNLQGKPPEAILEVLRQRDRKAAAAPAPACGLFLKTVEYPAELDNKCRKL